MAVDFDLLAVPLVAAFLFVFAVVFALLTSAKMFQRNTNAIIAVVFAVFSILYEPLVVGLQQFMPLAAVFFIIIFFIVFLKKVFGPKKEGELFDAFPFVVSLTLLLLIFTTAGGADFILSNLTPLGLSTYDALFVAGLFLIILIFIAVYYHRGWPKPKE